MTKHPEHQPQLTALQGYLAKQFEVVRIADIQANEATYLHDDFELRLQIRLAQHELCILQLAVPKHLQRCGVRTGVRVVKQLKKYAEKEQLFLLACGVDATSRGFWTHPKLGFIPQPYSHQTLICR